jgi:hypothetical protein
MKMTLDVRLAGMELVSEGYEFDGMLELEFDCEEESVGLHLRCYIPPENARERLVFPGQTFKLTLERIED